MYQWITLCADPGHPSTEREREETASTFFLWKMRGTSFSRQPIMDLLKSWCRASMDATEIDACGLHGADREPGHDGPSERRRGGRIHNGMSWVVCPLSPGAQAQAVPGWPLNIRGVHTQGVPTVVRGFGLWGGNLREMSNIQMGAISARQIF